MKNKFRLYRLYIYVSLILLVSISFGKENKENKSKSLSSSFSQAKFLPDISFILDISAVYRNIENDEYKEVEIPGLVHGGHHEDHVHSHAMANENIGFNLNYGELSLYSAVDPYFELIGIFHLSLESFEIEEGYFNTTFLPFGLGLKIGKFLSSFGRLNSQHAHMWNFTDQPLIYYTLFGCHGIDEIGVQLSWLTKLNFYLQMGAEILMGNNENSFGTKGFNDANHLFEVKSAKGPNLSIGFLKTSFDIKNYTIFIGFSGAYGRTRINHGIANVKGHGVSAKTWLLGGDITHKFYIDSYRYISLQAEYIHRNIKGDHFYVESNFETEKSSILKKQSGFYSELIIKPLQRWKIGLRGDLLPLNKVKIGEIEKNLPENLYKLSGMVDFMPSEFSLFRLQYNYDRSKYIEEKLKVNHEIILQANISIGAHGAHSF